MQREEALEARAELQRALAQRFRARTLGCQHLEMESAQGSLRGPTCGLWQALYGRRFERVLMHIQHTAYCATEQIADTCEGTPECSPLTPL